MTFRLWNSIDLDTSRAKTTAKFDSAPPAAFPAAKLRAAWVVDSQNCEETSALADRGQRAAASAADDKTMPRRVSWRRSFSRARASRLRSVPAGQRSRRAASSRVMPSK
ncbi:MAG: hypothetical protein ACLQVF_15590 [Isosphaeraceae bacterium]